tara:strand:+ start:5209 stop:6030 length:822 start_codon:yes stop_codon:yes gene_type:complete
MSTKAHMDEYASYVKGLQAKEVTFKVVLSGMSRVVHFLDAYGNTTRKRTFFGLEGDKRMDGLEFIMMVRREIRKRIDEGEQSPYHLKGTKVVAFNIEALKEASLSGEEVIAIDLNACYWKTAFNLGFISSELFIKGWEKRKKSKLGLVASIGSLNKRSYEEQYIFGKSKGLNKIEKDDDLRPYYWAIINEVNKIMTETIEKLQKPDFFMWLTDCVYVRKSSKLIAEEYFNSIGYDYKISSAQITKVERNRVFWANKTTGEEKYIFYSKDTCIK